MVGRHFGCLYDLTIINNASVNVGAQGSLQNSDFISFGSIPRSGNAGSLMVVPFLISLGTSKLFSIVATPVDIPTNSAPWFLPLGG